MLSLSNTAASPRLTALRLVWSPSTWGESKGMAVMVMLLFQALVMAAVLRPSTDLGLALLLLLMPLLAGITAATERAAVRPLAFVKRLPLAIASPKWLVVGPLCAMAGGIVAGIAATYRLPFLQAVSLFGLACWSVSMGHWLASCPLRLLIFLMPLTCWLGVAAFGAAHGYGGDGSAALAAMTLAALGLLASPREVVFQWGERGGVQEQMQRATSRARRPRRAGGLVTAFRIWFVTMPRLSRYITFVLFLIQVALLAAYPSPAVPFGWLWLPILLGSGLAGTVLAPATLGFLRTRPFARTSVLGGTILPSALLVVSLPLLSILTVKETRFIGPQATFMQPAVRRADQLFHLRHRVGATFLPVTTPAGGLPPEAWPALQSVLRRHAFRTAFLLLAFLFAYAGAFRPATKALGAHRPPVWPGRVALVITGFMLAPCLTDLTRPWRVPWPSPPLWLAVSWAVIVTIAVSARAIGIDPRATIVKLVARPRA